MSAQLSSPCSFTASPFAADVIAGLSHEQKRLPSKYFYDKRGSELFDEICELPEYYPTRTEIAIMHEYGDEMARAIGDHTMLIELGSGSSTKTGWLLRHLPRPACYVPVDISREHLLQAAHRISQRFPDIEVRPLPADFGSEISLPEVETTIARRVVYFPGSTIGNFQPAAALQLLTRIHQLAGPHGGLLVGFDLVKDRQTLEHAYNDRAKVTARFNKNLLRRINRELAADFELSQFDHHAVYNASHHRIEMHLVSCRDQVVTIGGREFPFAQGESIRTELSHKYQPAAFDALVASAGFGPGITWTDANHLFAVAYYPVHEEGQLPHPRRRDST